jgi:hypothetical protein
MSSQFDNTYQHSYSQPTYDSVQDKIKYQVIREADYVLEESIPRQPT